MDKKRIYELDTITEADLEKDNYLLVDFEGSSTAKKFKLRDILNIQHEHENKGVLDGITAEDVNKWNSYQEYDDSEIREAINANSVAQHTHENKGILDGITQEDIASIHSHNNMDFLEKCEYIYFNSSSSLDFVKEGLFLVKFSELDWNSSINEAKSSGKFAKFDGITTGNSENKQIFLVMYIDKTVSESKTTDGIVYQGGITKKYGHQIFFGDGTIYKRKITEITEQTNLDVFNPVYETTYEFEPLEEIGSSGTEVDSAQIMGLQYYDDADIVPSDQSLFTFTVNDDGTTATLSGITGETISGNIVIPYKYTDENGNEYIVTDIGDSAFYEKTYDLNVVILPNTIKIIGNEAFLDCISLTNITIPDSVTSIGFRAFGSCYDLTPITIPNSVTSIGDMAFFECYNLTNIIIPNSVTSIGDEAFSSCRSLTNITIPDSVTNIDSYAFENCATAVEGAEFTIICSAGSYAEQYAKENGIKYKYTITDIVATSVITSLNGESVILEHNQDLRISATVLNIHTPNEIPENYYSLLTLAPSETEITLTFSGEPITWRGDDVDSNGVFIPELNTMYRIAFELVYTNIDDEGNTTYTIVARVGVV